MLGKHFERKDRIGYEFEGYDLIFACFERRGWVEPKLLPNSLSSSVASAGAITASAGADGNGQAVEDSGKR